MSENISTAVEVPWMDETTAMENAANIIINYDLISIMRDWYAEEKDREIAVQIMADYTILELAVKDLLHYAARLKEAAQGGAE